MNELYQALRLELENELTFMEDKPEENIDTSIMALWHKAAGSSFSAEEASIHPLPELSDQQKTQLNQLIERRINGTPLAYLTSRQKFMGIELICDQRALIPRKETEILGKKSLSVCQEIAKQKESIRVFDVCCGSGNLGLAIAYTFPNAIVYSSDLSEEAIALTLENISMLNIGNQVNAMKSDLFSNFESEDYYHSIDLIVCNPPYISTSKVSKMNIEISDNEPFMAFDGGMIGMKVIQNLIREAPKFLTAGGWLVFEVGEGQGSFITQLCEKSQHYTQIEQEKDDAGNIRVISACRKEVEI